LTLSPAIRSFLCLLVLLLPVTALAEGIELRPGEPPTPVPLPPGVSAEQVRVSLDSVELTNADPTPQPALRTVFVAGMPVDVGSSVPQGSPLRVEIAHVGGRDVVLLSARRATEAGNVRRVVARVVFGDGLRAVRPVPAGWREAVPEPEKVLAIVITNRLLERSASLRRYVQWREAGGYTVIVGTEDVWDQPVTEGPDHRTDRIRAWLRQLRDSIGLGYVLLIGSPDPRGSVPMQLTRPLGMLIPYYPPDLAEALDPVPTDHYYADLDGNWDLDEDGDYAEYPDDDGLGGVEWDADAMVGRLPVYGDDATALDAMLEAIIAYETDPSPSWRHRVLLPAAFLGFAGSPAPGGGSYEETADGASPAMAAYEAVSALDADAVLVRLFEEEGVVTSEVEHERALTTEDLLDEWAQGAGIVMTYAHGDVQGDYRTTWLYDANENGVPEYSEMGGGPFISSWDAPSLAGAGRAFTFHASCENGWPEYPDNLGTSLLHEGAIGSVVASRAAIGGEAVFRPAPELGDADTMAYTFAYLLLEGMRAGEAMAYLRYGLPADEWGSESGIPLNGYGWIGKLEYNLYGDPTVGLGVCEGDADCADGSLCNGESRCVDGFCVAGELVDCSSLDGDCVMGRCDRATGTCTAVPRAAGTVCDDTLFCTEDDRCYEGTCEGLPRECGEAPEGFESSCVEADRRCVVEPIVPDAGPDADADADADADEVVDGDTDADGADAGAYSVGGGGCAAVAAPPARRLLAALVGL
jgi:hypothetical protein